MANAYDKRKTKSVSSINSEDEELKNNPFVKNIADSQEAVVKTTKKTQKKNPFKGKTRKNTFSYSLSLDIVEAIDQIVSESQKNDPNSNVTKSLIVEQILREYLTKNGYLD